MKSFDFLQDIMRFSLQDMKRDHIELQAHNKWIQSMCILDTYRPLLITACKEGRVKVWDITSTRKLRLVDQVFFFYFMFFISLFF